MTTKFQISSDLEASLEPDGADYTGNLMVRSESLDDWDLYALNADGEWECTFDSLTNKIANEDHQAAWPATDAFQAWIEAMKAKLAK